MMNGSKNQSSNRTWGDIESIREEWPKSELDVPRDLDAWNRAKVLFENDDYDSMMSCAKYFSFALAHNLYGPGILPESEIVHTVNSILYSSVAPPPDGQTFVDMARKCARLALTFVREYGWQRESLGGTGQFDGLIEDTGNHGLYSAAIAIGDQIVGDLSAFFLVPPSLHVHQGSIPDPSEDLNGVMEGFMDAADRGDVASEHFVRAFALLSNDDLPGAISELEASATSGNSRAMYVAGDLAEEIGDVDQAEFWHRQAARAGDARAMFQLGVQAFGEGDLEIAAVWYQRAAEAGEPEGFAALTQMADDRGDDIAFRNWVKLGADAGQPFCVLRYGGFLFVNSNGNPLLLREALQYAQTSAERGDLGGMMLAGGICATLGDIPTSQSWFDEARASGDPAILERLRKLGV
jgi:TPR repeat protein